MGSLEAMAKGSEARYLSDTQNLKIAQVGCVGVLTNQPTRSCHGGISIPWQWHVVHRHVFLAWCVVAKTLHAIMQSAFAAPS